MAREKNNKSILNHKLYNKYYPIQTEEERETFLCEDKMELVKALRRAVTDLKAMEMYRMKSAGSAMKKPYSVFGTVKWNAVMHNKMVSQSLEIDLKKIEKRKEKPESALNKFTMHSNEDISMDDINDALTIINKRKRWQENWFLMRGTVCGVLAIIALILYLCGVGR